MLGDGKGSVLTSFSIFFLNKTPGLPEQATKIKVQKMLKATPASFRSFFQSETFDSLASTCLSYFIAGFTHDALCVALSKAKKQHQEGIKEALIQVEPLVGFGTPFFRNPCPTG
jgi:hypothetical protein